MKTEKKGQRKKSISNLIFSNNKFISIPEIAYRDKKLNNSSMLLFGMIITLSNKEKYCYATDKYFSEQLNLSPKTISKGLRELEENNYIIRKTKNVSKTKKKRLIIISEKLFLNNKSLFTTNDKESELNDSIQKDYPYLFSEESEKDTFADGIVCLDNENNSMRNDSNYLPIDNKNKNEKNNKKNDDDDLLNQHHHSSFTELEIENFRKEFYEVIKWWNKLCSELFMEKYIIEDKTEDELDLLLQKIVEHRVVDKLSDLEKEFINSDYLSNNVSLEGLFMTDNFIRNIIKGKYRKFDKSSDFKHKFNPSYGSTYEEYSEECNYPLDNRYN